MKNIFLSLSALTLVSLHANDQNGKKIWDHIWITNDTNNNVFINQASSSHACKPGETFRIDNQEWLKQQTEKQIHLYCPTTKKTAVFKYLTYGQAQGMATERYPDIKDLKVSELLKKQNIIKQLISKINCLRPKLK